MSLLTKDSRIKWIGEIPVDYNVVSVKRLFHIGRGRVIAQTELEENGQYPVYSSQTKNNGCMGYINSYDYDKPQLTWTTDGANAGTVFYREGKYNCTNVCGTLLPKTADHSLLYLKYCLEYIAVFHKRADINGFKIMNNEMAEIKIVIPPRTIQDRIANYLKSKCNEIEKIIEATKVSIEKYKDYKKAIITEAVTKGLENNIQRKESGVDWIGEIPVHWKTTKLKYLFSIKKKIANELGHNILSVTQSGLKIKDITSNEGQISADYTKYQIVDIGDFVMNHMDLLTGWVDCSEYKGVTSPDYRVFKLINEVNQCKKYYTYLFQSCYTNKVFFGLGQGVSNLGRWRLQTEKFNNFTIPIVPFTEQKHIVDYLDSKCSHIDKVIIQKQELISELEKYKKSLIYECVTGKIDVSELETFDKPSVIYPLFPVVLPTNKKRFAQAILASKVIETAHSSQFGRVKLEKMLYTLESHIGFDFETEYKREIAGPLDGSIYQCENMISQRNKWFSITKNKYGVRYSPTKEMSKYKTYYKKYYAEYDSEISRVINIFKPLSTDEAEIFATLYASWNDFIITGSRFNDEDIVDDVMNNWHDSKKRFSKETWLNAIEQMKKLDLVPKGYGKKTVSG